MGQKEFGGELLKGKRKSERPLNFKMPLHMILRGNIFRSGSLVWNTNVVTDTIERFAGKFGVKIYQKAIASNNIHMLVKFKDRKSYTRFARAVAGELARKLCIKWILRPFTRIVTWGRDFKAAIAYVVQNHLEAVGAIKYRPRTRRIKRRTRKTMQI